MRKRVTLLTISAAALLVCATALWAHAAGDAKSTITDLEHKCAAATSADQLMQECYDATDQVAVYDISPPREYDGAKAVHGDFDNFFKAIKSGKVEFVDLHVVTAGKMAYARSIQHFTGQSADGKPMDMTFRVTDVWLKENGQWKIIHTHVSFPVDLATGKADWQAKM
jgi:ketosteroid isomerase-like protein